MCGDAMRVVTDDQVRCLGLLPADPRSACTARFAFKRHGRAGLLAFLLPFIRQPRAPAQGLGVPCTGGGRLAGTRTVESRCGRCVHRAASWSSCVDAQQTGVCMGDPLLRAGAVRVEVSQVQDIDKRIKAWKKAFADRAGGEVSPWGTFCHPVLSVRRLHARCFLPRGLEGSRVWEP